MSEHLDQIFESPLTGSTHDGKIAIRDYTNKQRWGFRGQDAAATLRTEGWELSETPNRILSAGNQILSMALSEREFWFLDPNTNCLSPRLVDNAFKDGMYPLFCQSSHAWLVISGEQKSEMMAKLCGIDLSPNVFNMGDVAQTQMALINCIIARHELHGYDVLSLLVDQSFANYALEVLLDARLEFL